MSIGETDEPVQRCARKCSHKQLAMHNVSSSQDHHLGVEGRDVGLQVFDTCQGDFRSHEVGGYYHIHDRLGKRHDRRMCAPSCVAVLFAVPHWPNAVLLCLFMTHPYRPGIGSNWLSARPVHHPESCPDQLWTIMVSMSCCMVTLSPPSNVDVPCLVFLMLLDGKKCDCEWDLVLSSPTVGAKCSCRLIMGIGCESACLCWICSFPGMLERGSV